MGVILLLNEGVVHRLDVMQPSQVLSAVELGRCLGLAVVRQVGEDAVLLSTAQIVHGIAHDRAVPGCFSIAGTA